MDWSKHYAESKGYRRWPSEELVRFMSTIPDTDHSFWLEAGCGGGGNLAALAAPGRTVVGIDRYLPALNVARSLAGGASLAVADIFGLPFCQDAFDGVVDSMVSQHVESSRHVELYSEYRRVLKPGGVLFVYHLDFATDCVRIDSLGGDHWTNLSLFPSVPFFCLPRPEVLWDWIELAGFNIQSTARLLRTYSQNDVASYSIVCARKA